MQIFQPRSAGKSAGKGVTYVRIEQRSPPERQSYEKDKQKIYTQTVVAEDIALINRSSDQGVSATVRVVNESDLGEAEN